MNANTKLDSARRDNAANAVMQGAEALGEDLSLLARQAVDAIRQIADSLAARASDTATRTVDAAGSAGDSAAEAISAVKQEAKDIATDSLAGLGEIVSKRPVAALAIAAGVGLLLGYLTRSDSRR